MGQFSNSFPKHFSYLCEYAIRFDLSCSYCEYPVGMQIRSEFNLNSPNSLRIRSQRKCAANSA